MEQIRTTFVQIAPRVPGVLYEPMQPSAKSKAAVLVMHSDEDYLSFPTGEQLAKRGYRVLCANVAGKEGILYTQIEKMKNLKAAVLYLRSISDVEKIILMGHSGGGTLMSAYQAVAENGPSIFRDPEKMIYPYPDDEKLPPADGIMLLDSNWGNAAMQLFSLDPAVEDENSGKMINEELNLFSPANGFLPEGSVYPDEFIKKFQKAQSERNNGILDYALNRLLLLEQGSANFDDDEPMIISGSAQGFFNNKLYAQDIRLMSRTRNEHKLLHADGSCTVERVYSLRTPENNRSFTPSFWEGARFLSVRTYLSSYAVRTENDYGFDEDHVWGIDWKSTYSCPVGNMEYVHVPALIMGMTGGWEFLASETIYEHTASMDKDLAFVEGATHKFNTAKHLEKYTGQYGDTMKTLHDYVDRWIEDHFFSGNNA
ncbi:MAG: alpha/beta hydrolase [Blautia sp.]|nr:alpha/beta hydrolase [Blautia sp.]